MSTSTTSSTEERALTLLGQGILPEQVAAALGVTPAVISGLVSDPDFAHKVADLRFQNLSRHNVRDNSYDQLEDEMIERFKEAAQWIMKPLEMLRALEKLNGMKRRGQSSPEALPAQQTVVTLVMPVVTMQKFTTQNHIEVNTHNQVIKAGEQELITTPSSSMESILAAHRTPKLPPPEQNHVQIPIQTRGERVVQSNATRATEIVS